MPLEIYKPLGETYGYTVGNTLVSLPTIPNGATRVMIQVESQDIRAKFNATNSTTYGVTGGVAGGLLLPVNTVATPFYVFNGRDLMDRMRMKANGSTASSVNIVFLGEQEITAYNG